jgi:hypothetical protein
MGKIADAIERHEKDTVFRPDDLKDARSKRLVVVEPEVKLAHQIASDRGFEKGFSDKLVVLTSPDSADAEIFKVLRGQILVLY